MRFDTTCHKKRRKKHNVEWGNDSTVESNTDKSISDADKNLGFNYTFPIDLVPNRIPFGAKLERKI